MINIDEIKNRLENSSRFKYEQEEINISFEDFKIIDLNTDAVLQQGSSKAYSILIDKDKLSFCFPL